MNETTSPQEEKGGNKKKYMLIGVGLIVALGLIYYIADKIFIYLGQREVQKMAETMQEYEEQALAAQMADTYGGTTPQETLRLFIEAMEKEDYELASKYFIIERQEDELEGMKTAPKENIENVLVMLRECLEKMENNPLEEVGSYSFDGVSGYMISEPIVVDFYLYASGTWKIVKI